MLSLESETRHEQKWPMLATELLLKAPSWGLGPSSGYSPGAYCSYCSYCCSWEQQWRAVPGPFPSKWMISFMELNQTRPLEDFFMRDMETLSLLTFGHPYLALWAEATTMSLNFQCDIVLNPTNSISQAEWQPDLNNISGIQKFRKPTLIPGKNLVPSGNLT